MGNMEQMPLEFEAEGEAKLTELSTKALEKLYHAKVEKDPTFRFLGATDEDRRAILIEGINSKEKALERLGLIDAGDDKAARDANYWDR